MEARLEWDVHSEIVDYILNQGGIFFHGTPEVNRDFKNRIVKVINNFLDEYCTFSEEEGVYISDIKMKSDELNDTLESIAERYCDQYVDDLWKWVTDTRGSGMDFYFFYQNQIGNDIGAILIDYSLEGLIMPAQVYCLRSYAYEALDFGYSKGCIRDK